MYSKFSRIFFCCNKGWALDKMDQCQRRKAGSEVFIEASRIFIFIFSSTGKTKNKIKTLLIQKKMT